MPTGRYISVSSDQWRDSFHQRHGFRVAASGPTRSLRDQSPRRVVDGARRRCRLKGKKKSADARRGSGEHRSTKRSKRSKKKNKKKKTKNDTKKNKKKIEDKHEGKTKEKWQTILSVPTCTTCLSNARDSGIVLCKRKKKRGGTGSDTRGVLPKYLGIPPRS